MSPINPENELASESERIHNYVFHLDTTDEPKDLVKKHYRWNYQNTSILALYDIVINKVQSIHIFFLNGVTKTIKKNHFNYPTKQQ